MVVVKDSSMSSIWLKEPVKACSPIFVNIIPADTLTNKGFEIDTAVSLPEGIRRDVELADLVTLHTPAVARYYLRADCLATIRLGLSFAREQALPVLLLGAA